MRLNKKYSNLILFWVMSSIGLMAQNPNWNAPNSAEFSNTATVISNLALDGSASDNPGDRIAFFVDDEIRGLSTPVLLGNSNYLHFITLYSNVSIEDMDIKMYHQGTDKVYAIAEDFEFETGGTYGNVDEPYSIKAYNDGNPPLYFEDILDQMTLEGIPFQTLDLMNYLIQEGNNEIIWSFTPNPDLEVSLSGSLLNVSGSMGFIGQAPLTIRATQLAPPAQITGLQFGAPQIVSSYIETTINFIVSPTYNGPAWYTIPPQSIVKGDMFTPVNLHDYEYQYDGPVIQYDYLPILLPLKDPQPIPSWEFTELLEVNMSVTIQMDYTPKYQFHHEEDRIAAFIGNELRGVSRRDSISHLHFLTIGGSTNENEQVTLMFYSGQKKKIYEIDSILNFQPYHILGSIVQPFTIDLSPLLPIVPELPIPGGIAAVPIEIIDTSYVGIEHFKFIAYDPIYPTFFYADTSTSFCISEDVLGLNTLYADFDGDGLGDPNISVESCAGVLNYVTNSDDCDDTNTIFCAEEITVGSDPGVCEATEVVLIEPSFEDCHVTSITNNAPPAYPQGKTLVTWTVEFNEMVTKTCTQVVTVVDDEAPTPVEGGTSLTWDEVTAVISGDGTNDQQFGYSVDLSDKWAIVGAKGDSELGPSAGAAYLLWFDGMTWTEHTKLVASNGLKQDAFGQSVSISENRVLIGAPGVDLDGIDKGATYVFEYDGDNWIETEILVASNGNDGDFFGTSVSISNGILIVGAHEEDTGGDNSGAAYVFELKDGWTEVAILKADDGESDDQFGIAVSLSGTNAVIGARYEDAAGNNAGAAYVFERDNNIGNWFQSEKLAVSNTGPDFEFGTSVDISGTHVIVGSPRNNANGIDAGAAYVFSKTGIDWIQEQFLLPENGMSNDKFGTSVSISANYASVGASAKSLDGIDGGAAYIFRNDGNIWTLQDSLLASDGVSGDLFGSATAIYGHNVITGAYSKDSAFVDVGKSYFHALDAAIPIKDTPCPITFDPPLAVDNCDGDIIGILAFTSEYTGLGIYEIAWTYTDSSGNTSFQYQFVQLSEDTIPPVLMCPNEVDLQLDNTGNLLVSFDESILTPSDNCGMVTLEYFPESFDCSNLGMDTVLITASDAMGNMTTCEIPVVINEGPKIVENIDNDGIGSLRYLIEGSCGGDQSVIYFDTTLNGSISLFAPSILIDKDIEIFGLGKSVINIDGQNTIRIFQIDNNSTFILRRMQLSNGQEQLDGGAILNYGILKLDDVRFIGNKENNEAKALTNQGQINIIGGVVEIRE
jgi:hypothetical protein